ncbi:MAG: LysM peptidoglycan-binding domain-containing protein [Cytophagales bacterium]|nr:LysM peptidoglycan-binding domain-containing protein [Cytophagales bacterium]
MKYNSVIFLLFFFSSIVYSAITHTLIPLTRNSKSLFPYSSISPYPSCDSIGVQKIKGKLHLIYLVSAGETIYGISTKHGVPIAGLLEINPALENGLKTGQVINIPYHPDVIKRSGISEKGIIIHIVETGEHQPTILVEKQTFKEAIIHIVKPGETLWSLSKKYNISLDQLMGLNDLHIKAGQKLIVGYKAKGEVETVEKVLAKEYIKSRKKEDMKKVKEIKEVKEVEDVEEIEEKEVNTEIEVKGEIEGIDDQYPETNTPPEYSGGSMLRSDKNPVPGTQKKVLVVPFDPYLYFSDADDEIAAASGIPRTKVRQVFRKNLNTMIQSPDYETVHLMGGSIEDSVTDLNKIYRSLTYNYQDLVNEPDYVDNYAPPKEKALPVSLETVKRKLKKSPESPFSGRFGKMKFENKYFGAKIKDPKFFEYFNKKYDLGYYIFVTQFEVNTNYEHCLDRTRQDYERDFIVHYSIYNREGKQIAGSKIKIFYNSNSNNIQRIIGDNIQKMANRIIAALPGKGISE